MRWTLAHGDILDRPADVLVCSANVFLNLSGGVGGEILLRCGVEAQRELHAFLASRGRHFAAQGDVIRASAHGLPFRAVLHAVAVDGFYQSTPALVRAVVGKSLGTAARLGARRVALTALATGYGRMSMGQFAVAIGPLVGTEVWPLEEVCVCLRGPGDHDDLARALVEFSAPGNASG